ncbi:unnamed protein product [Ectocarpus sp. 4 AP-2014]
MSSGTGPQRGLFNVPVDPLKLGIPDYFKRVPHPMDLGTIKSRLLSMSYTTPEEFASDVRLVFKNAIGFNPETHFVHTWAVQLLNEFDQEYSKQIGKLDEGWAKSLSHSCQLCQGQTCTLCGDKCLKLEPPVIICHHCNKRVVRGGVYHITRDGCRLWCSRCHPGLPPELPIDGDPEGIVAEETAEGGGSSVASTGGGDCGEGGGAAASGSSSTAAEGETPQPQPSVATPPTTGEGRAAAPGSGVLMPGGVSSPSPVQPPPPGTAAAAAAVAPAVSTAEGQQPARTPSPPSTAAPVEAIANGGGGVNHGSSQNGGGSAPAAGEGGREASPAGAANGSPPAAPAAAAGRAVSELGSANGATGAPPAASESGGSVGGGGATAGATAAVEEVKAPLKRDLLRRKFDEEISEPWVQCDRCNSWVHQVCALFNARANVGEARFVCPVCRLRNVVTTKKPGSQEPEAATEGEATTARKRPKSIDGNGNLLPVCPVKTEETAAGASPPVGTATAPAAPEQPAAAAAVAVAAAKVAVTPAPVAADAGASASAPPVIAPREQAAEAVNGIMGGFVGGETARAPPAAHQQQQQAIGPAPMEGVTPSPLPAASAAAGTAANTTATTSGGGGGGATPCLDRLLSPPESTPPTAQELPTPPAPAVANGGGAHVPGGTMAPAQAAAPAPAAAAAAAAAVTDPSAPERPVAATTGGDKRVDGGCVANGEAKATAAAGVGCDKAAGEAEGAAAATSTATVSAIDPMEVDEDLGAEAAGDEASGTAGADSLDVYAASSLPHTPLSRYIESRVRQRLAKLEDEAAASTLSIRLISNVEATCEVHAVLRETFCCKDGLGVGPNKNDVPELLKYRSKALSMFQRVDGVEVCLFSMYVQEYGADAPYFNARRAYISYLDSVEYFRPRRHRTAVYHEILVAYLDWLRRRGFKAAHIWSCPPQRGNNFIFWCHPLHQKTPTRDRLSGWYGNMLKRAVQLGVAAKVTTLDKTHFTEVERIGILLKNRRTSAAASAAATLAGVKGPDDLPLRPEIPVIFEGDFWAEEAVRLARAVERRDDGQDETQSPLELCRQALEELIRHQHGAPFTAPVDPTRDRCPDYLMVIEQPMDLGTVAETLDAMKYHDAAAFVSDVRLIFDNARKYNPPKHPIHVAASKLAKRSIPWAFDAIGPLSALARKTWAAHSARTARAVGTLPPMSESSPVEVGMPATVPSCRGLSGGATCGGGGGGGSTDKSSAADAPPHSNGGERLSRSGSTAVMSVSEFYGPSGARILQRRSSTASQLSLADSYGEGESLESVSATREDREGQAALTSLISEPLPQQPVAGSNGGVAQAQPAPAAAAAAAARQQPSPPTVGAPAPPSAWSTRTWPPGRQQQQQQQALGPSAAAGSGETAAGSGEAAAGNAPSGLTSPVEAAAAAALTATPAAAAAAVAAAAAAHPSEASAPAAAPVAVAPVPQAPGPTTPGSEAAGGIGRGSGSPPPLTLDPPHPSAANGAAASVSVLNPASAAGATAASTTPTPKQAAKAAAGGSARPASSMSLPWIIAPGSTATAATARPLAEEPLPEDQQQNQRAGLIRAMSVDSAPSPARPHARSLSFTGGGGGASDELGGGLGRASSGSEAFRINVNNKSGGSGSSSGRSTVGGGGGGGGGGPTVHSPRLRAKSMDSGGRKGKSKRGKGPGTAVMGKADRIGRMLQSLSRAVTRISKDLLVVTLGKPDQPAKPPPARAGSGMTKEAMLAELEAWHASSGIEGTLTPDCHDPDPPISRALVDARHTFLEMCQFRHYQFDTLRRAKHSSAMVLYHLHRPESRSLNPFCSRCRRPVRFVRYHCGVCNYDLCAECDEEVDTKCEDGHPLTPYRVTFSTEDAEESPAPGTTPATGGTSLSPRRSPVRERGGGGCARHVSPAVGGSAAATTTTTPSAAAVVTPAAAPSVLPADDCGDEAGLNHLLSPSPPPPPTRGLRAVAGGGGGGGEVNHCDAMATAVTRPDGSNAVAAAPAAPAAPAGGSSRVVSSAEASAAMAAAAHAGGGVPEPGGRVEETGVAVAQAVGPAAPPVVDVGGVEGEGGEARQKEAPATAADGGT